MKIKMLSAKKGQFYILVALLLISYAFTLARQEVPVRKPRDTFQLLHEGYVSEGTAVVNNAVYEEADVALRFANFTSAYVAFAKSAEPNFRLAYLLRRNGLLTVGNRFDSSLNVTIGNADYLIASNAEQAASAANATIRLGGISHSFAFAQEDMQLKALFRTVDRLTTRVFVKN